MTSNIWNNRLPQIIAPFLCEKSNNRPLLLFEEMKKKKHAKFVTGLFFRENRNLMTITFGETIGELILDPLLVGLDKPNLKKVTTTENYLYKTWGKIMYRRSSSGYRQLLQLRKKTV